MPKAYSYIRFSTPEQAKGDSKRRQTDAAEAYARTHGLELDTELTFWDCGVSAFKGRNARDGQLGAFLRGVQDEIIPQGSFLLVESLDRISRDAIIEAQACFMQIVSAGIILVTLKDQRTYSRETINANPTDLIMSLLILMRAHEESSMKSARLKAVYDTKRKAARAGDKTKPFTRRTPAWIEWSDEGKEFRLIDERAKIVRKVYEWSDDGLGKQSIASRLNAEGVPVFEDGQMWHKSYIQKLLTNGACGGTFIPKRKEDQRDGSTIMVYDAPIRGYFPAAVPQGLYERVRAREATSAPRGKYAAAAVRSVVAGVARCGLCGSTMTRVAKGKYVYIVCTKAHAKAGCEYLAVPYGTVEESLRAHIGTLIDCAPKGGETAELEVLITGLEDQIDDLRTDGRLLLDEFRRSRSPLIGSEIAAVDDKIKLKGAELDEARRQRDAQASRFVIQRLNEMREAFNAQPFSVPEVNKALRACIKTIEINPRGTRMEIQWATGSWAAEGPPLGTRHTEPSGFSIEL